MNKEEIKNLNNHKDKPDTNQNHVKLLIHDFDYHPNKVSEELMVEPHSIGVKGEPYEIGPPHNRIKKIHEYNFWSHEWKISSNNFIGDIVEKYIHDFIIPNMPTLIKISKESDIQFSIVQYYYDGFNPGFHFDKSTVKVISDLGASIDIDLYCLSD
ncbi:hypothetical protein JCM14469_43520 [Desulfatiferula olefinivorans]